jgi:hypothetical protein
MMIYQPETLPTPSRSTLFPVLIWLSSGYCGPGPNQHAALFKTVGRCGPLVGVRVGVSVGTGVNVAVGGGVGEAAAAVWVIRA